MALLTTLHHIDLLFAEKKWWSIIVVPFYGDICKYLLREVFYISSVVSQFVSYWTNIYFPGKKKSTNEDFLFCKNFFCVHFSSEVSARASYFWNLISWELSWYQTFTLRFLISDPIESALDSKNLDNHFCHQICRLHFLWPKMRRKNFPPVGIWRAVGIWIRFLYPNTRALSGF